MANCTCLLRCSSRRDVYSIVLAWGKQVMGPDCTLKGMKTQSHAGTRSRKERVMLDSSTLGFHMCLLLEAFCYPEAGACAPLFLGSRCTHCFLLPTWPNEIFLNTFSVCFCNFSSVAQLSVSRSSCKQEQRSHVFSSTLYSENLSPFYIEDCLTPFHTFFPCPMWPDTFLYAIHKTRIHINISSSWLIMEVFHTLAKPQ